MCKNTLGKKLSHCLGGDVVCGGLVGRLLQDQGEEILDDLDALSRIYERILARYFAG